MSEQILDGTGNNYRAKVDAKNRLSTRSVSTSDWEHISAEEEQAYYLSSGFIAVTNAAGTSALIYIENTGDGDIHIAQVRTCGTMSQQWTALKNPTSGTIVSNAVAGNNANINFASAKTLPSNVYQGVDGDTITDGDTLATWINNSGHSVHDLSGAVIIKKGNSLGLKCLPAADGTICISVLAYLGVE